MGIFQMRSRSGKLQRVDALEPRDKHEPARRVLLDLHSHSELFEGYLILLNEEALHVVDGHVVERHDHHHSQDPRDVPDHAQRLQVPHSAACDDGEALQPCVSLLQRSGEHAEGDEDGDGEVVGEDGGHRVHRLHQLVELFCGDDVREGGGIAAVSGLVVVEGLSEEAAKPLGTVVVEAGDHWAGGRVQSLLHMQDLFNKSRTWDQIALHLTF
jgi:hypothetical protein